MGRFFRRKTVKPKVKPRRSQETLGGGHRGIAAGSLAKPDYSQENVAKWRTLPASTVEGFVYDQEIIFFHSTNVNAAQYFLDKQKLLVEFKDGSSYAYSNVTEDEAIQLAKAQSKGSAVWDLLRVRGSRTAHKKPFSKAGAGFKKPERKPEDIEIDGVVYEVIREGGGATRYRIKD